MNIPMFWITLDLVELYYSGLSLRVPRRVAREDGRGEGLHLRQRRDGGTGGQARAGEGRGAG